MARLSEIIDKIDIVEKLEENKKVRGSVYLVSFPYRIKLPINLFYCCNGKCSDENCSKCKIETRYSCDGCVNEQEEILNYCKGYSNNFSEDSKSLFQLSKKVDPDKSTRSIHINTVQKMKIRPYLILSANIKFLNDYVYGAPIFSIKERQLKNKDYIDLLQNQKIPQSFYIDKISQGVDRPSYIDLTRIMPINKNLLIEYKGYIEPEDMIKISNNITMIFDLKQFDKDTINFARSNKAMKIIKNVEKDA